MDYFLHALSSYEMAVLGISVAAATLFALRVRQQPNTCRTASKTLSTALLSVFAIIRQGPSCLTLALALGSMGDAVLAWDEGDEAFLGGLSSFLVAHLFYIKLFFDAGSSTETFLAETWRVTLATVMVVVAPLMNILMMPRVGSKLRVPVAIYCAVIFTMFLTVLGIDDIRVVVGALLFTTSDAILATDRFLVSADSSWRAWMQYSVWILYYTGQLLIALGITLG